jgi:hypothetical protein
MVCVCFDTLTYVMIVLPQDKVVFHMARRYRNEVVPWYRTFTADEATKLRAMRSKETLAAFKKFKSISETQKKVASIEKAHGAGFAVADDLEDGGDGGGGGGGGRGRGRAGMISFFLLASSAFATPRYDFFFFFFFFFWNSLDGIRRGRR